MDVDPSEAQDGVIDDEGCVATRVVNPPPTDRAFSDVDGDGEIDAIETWGGTYPTHRRVVLARGVASAVTAIDYLEDGVVIAPIDLDGDARQELLVDLFGNTIDLGGVLQLVGCRLVRLADPDDREVAYTFASRGHSNCCLRHAVTLTCEPLADGVTALAEGTAVPVDRATGRDLDQMEVIERGDAPLTYRWERRVLVLRGGLLHVVEKTTGIDEQARVPHGILANELVC